MRVFNRILRNKKGRGKNAPTFLIINVYQCQYIRGQKLELMKAIASDRRVPALISKAYKQRYKRALCSKKVRLLKNHVL
ncbi:hypothetical protein A8A54_03565 [Brucella pseudogrignonensis]|nr:hypothetical protein A8A54_03565 [Brucella pseudogrignonensis]